MKEDRIIYFDVLNIIACIAVVFLHHNGIVHQFTPTSSWSQALVIEVLCYWAVPVFFMLTGATLLNYRDRYDTKTFFKQRAKRALVPFMIWSCVWVVLCYFRDGISLQPIDIISGIVHTEYQPVYWFFIPLFGLYILLPALSLLYKDTKVMTYLSVAIFVFTVVYSPICNILNFNKIACVDNAMAGPILYLLLGKILSIKKVGAKSYLFILITALLCFIFRYLFTFNMSYQDNAVNKSLFNYYYFTAVIPAVWVFLTAQRLVSSNVSEKKMYWLKVISSCSLGIYLLHHIVMAAEVRIFHADPSSVLWRLVLPMLTYTVCLFVVFACKKTKLGRIIFP